MKYYLIYRNKDDTFYAWTDSKELLELFMRMNSKKYHYIKTDTLLELGMEKYEIQVNDYQLDAFFQGQNGQDKYPLILRTDEFGLLETSMYNTLYYLNNMINGLSSYVKYFRENKTDRKMMESVCNIISSDINEVISDDEPVYGDIIKISKYYKEIGIR